MSRSVSARDTIKHVDPELAHHRAWLLAVLEQLVAHEPEALEEGGTLRRLWTARQEIAPTAPPPSAAAPTACPTSKGNPLSVPWFAQLDSATDQARHMCFSSSCAMLLAYLKPGVLTGPNGDDQYLARVRQFEDTTDAPAQIRALASYGIKARFTSEMLLFHAECRHELRLLRSQVPMAAMAVFCLVLEPVTSHQRKARLHCQGD
jgi:hypothetical protein